MFKSIRIACVAAVALALMPDGQPAHADGIGLEIENIGDQPFAISMLAAYGENNIRVGNWSDILFPAGSTMTFLASGQIKSYAAVGDDNKPMTLRNVSKVVPDTLSFIEDMFGGMFVALEIDAELANLEPPRLGSMLEVIVGEVFFEGELLPGWFVGQAFDIQTGSVTVPFDGFVEITDQSLIGTVVPGPGGAALLLLGAGRVGARSRRRRR